VALVNMGITINKIGDIREFTGYASDTGEANVTVESSASVQFFTSTINWGSGSVDEAASFSYMDTEGNEADGNFTAVSQGLTLQNDGNCNVTFTLTSSNIASQFIGGTSPVYNIKLSDNESDSCCGANSISTYTNATSAAQQACDNFSYSGSNNTVDVDINISIPEDATSGAHGSIITATAECI
jgi:hypothetical protein